ncbi:hypothetical protein SK128_002349, partial [Halocaridina rubra]
ILHSRMDGTGHGGPIGRSPAGTDSKHGSIIPSYNQNSFSLHRQIRHIKRAPNFFEESK